MGIVIGIDVGGSTTKIVGLNKGKIQSPMFITAADPVTSLFGAFGKYIYDNGATCVAQISVPGPPTHFPASQEEASSLHPGGLCPEFHRRCVLAGVRGEGKGKAVEGEKVLAEARRCAGPFGRRGIARLLWRCEDVEGS